MKRLQAGLSIIELLIVVAIIGVLIAVISYPFGTFRNKQALDNSANTVVSILQEARARTLGGVNDTNYSVRFETNRIVLFVGSAYNASATTNEAYSYESPVTLSSTSLAGGATAVTFDRLKGTTSQSGTVTLSNGTKTSVITVSASGSITRS
jgi:prepilin-type N-terminal cleavage/methylation domain-containing protein